VASGNARLKRAQSGGGSERAVARKVSGIIADLVPRFGRIEERIRLLDPPPGESRFAAGYLVYTERINDLFAASGRAAAANDIEAFEAFGDRSRAAAIRRDRLVRRHGGLPRCVTAR
jgi:hypothetical protein